MKNQIIIIVLFILFSTGGCEKQKSEEFNAKEIGWTINTPKNWKIENQRKISNDIKEGLEMIKKNNDIGLSLSGKEISLINFQKNELSKLQATIIPFKENYKGEWNDKYPLIKNYIYSIFISQGFSVDSTSNKEKIDGIDFEIFNMKISQNNRFLMEQNMYRSYINGYDFIVNMTNDNITYKEQMLKALRNSKFTNLKE